MPNSKRQLYRFLPQLTSLFLITLLLPRRGEAAVEKVRSHNDAFNTYVRTYEICKESDSSFIPFVNQCNLLSPNLFFSITNLDDIYIKFYHVNLFSSKSMKDKDSTFSRTKEVGGLNVRTFLSLFRNSTHLAEWLQTNYYKTLANRIIDPEKVFLEELTSWFRDNFRDVNLEVIENILENYPKYKKELRASLTEYDLIEPVATLSAYWENHGFGGCHKEDENTIYFQEKRNGLCQKFIKVPPRPREPYEKMMKLLFLEAVTPFPKPKHKPL